VQCSSCEEFITEEVEFCPSCGSKLKENIFKEEPITALAKFCEEAIEAM
jgi:serine protease Do